MVAGDAVDLAADAGIEPEREVDLAAAQQRGRVLGLGHDQRQLDAGVLGAEGGDRERHQRRGGGLEGGQAQAAAAQAGDRLQLGLGLAESRARIASAWRTSASPASVSRIPRALRWTSVQPASRSSAAICCEMADCVKERDSAAALNEPRTRDLPEHPHAANVEHQKNLYHRLQKVI